MFDEEVENYHCGHCEWFNNCKRIDHTAVKFATPWFKSYDRNQHSGCVCSDFKPASWCVFANQNWKGFDYYWPRYVEQWLAYKNTNTLMYFTLHNNTSVRYGVPLMSFVNGTMIENGVLKAVDKTYYKRTKENPIGYKLIHENINGVKINNVKECKY